MTYTFAVGVPQFQLDESGHHLIQSPLSLIAERSGTGEAKSL